MGTLLIFVTADRTVHRSRLYGLLQWTVIIFRLKAFD